jgi:hypothetical protein
LTVNNRDATVVVALAEVTRSIAAAAGALHPSRHSRARTTTPDIARQWFVTPLG